MLAKVGSFLLIFWGAVAFGMFSWRALRGETKEAVWLAVAIAGAALTAVMGRVIWLPWYYYKEVGDNSAASSYGSFASDIAAIFIILSAVFYALHVRPFFLAWLGWAWGLGIIVLSIVLSFGIASLFS